MTDDGNTGDIENTSSSVENTRNPGIAEMIATTIDGTKYKAGDLGKFNIEFTKQDTPQLSIPNLKKEQTLQGLKRKPYKI